MVVTRDYDKIWESMMHYIGVPASDVDTQEKLIDYIEEKDTGGNTVSSFRKKLAKTDKAHAMLEQHKSFNKEEREIEEIKDDKDREEQMNNLRERRAAYRQGYRSRVDRRFSDIALQRKALEKLSYTPSGDLTDRKGNVHVTVKNKKGIDVYPIDTHRANGQIVMKWKDSTGRWAEKP